MNEDEFCEYFDAGIEVLDGIAKRIGDVLLAIVVGAILGPVYLIGRIAKRKKP